MYAVEDFVIDARLAEYRSDRVHDAAGAQPGIGDDQRFACSVLREYARKLTNGARAKSDFCRERKIAEFIEHRVA